MLHISKRIELATTLNITARHGASSYQVTNYGLAGLVETHTDAWGSESGVELPYDRRWMVSSGDVIATLMGWLSDVPEGGGGTAFAYPEYEGLIKPTKGSAAFWIDLNAAHVRDERLLHGGCPVRKGSKWILNKWIYSFNQWRNWPCGLGEKDDLKPVVGVS